MTLNQFYLDLGVCPSASTTLSSLLLLYNVLKSSRVISSNFISFNIILATLPPLSFHIKCFGSLTLVFVGAGSLLLTRAFSGCSEPVRGLLCSCGAQVSHCHDFSWCGALVYCLPSENRDLDSGGRGTDARYGGWLWWCREGDAADHPRGMTVSVHCSSGWQETVAAFQKQRQISALGTSGQ